MGKYKQNTEEVYAAGTPWEFNYGRRIKQYFETFNAGPKQGNNKLHPFPHRLDIGGTSDHSVIHRPGHEKEYPDWVFDEQKTMEVLRRSFPKMFFIAAGKECVDTQHPQFDAAARWLRVIHMYYRQNLNRKDIARQLKMNLGTVCSLLRSIKRAGEGRRANGKKPTGRRRGRPKNILGASSADSCVTTLPLG